MEEVWDSGKLAAAYTYKPDSLIAGIRYGNGVTVEYDYDSDKNVVGIVAKNSEGVEILKHSYEYDNNGNQVKKEENGKVTQYIYDSLNRLSKVVYPDVEELFSYDYAGNRIYRKKGSLETTYSYDTRNRLIEKIEGSEQTRYSYDSNGNLISESGKQGTISYTYDCFNRTERVRKSNGEYIRNFYDPEGLRSKIEENGRTAWFVYSGRDIVAELDGEKLRAASIRGHEMLMQRDGSGEQHYYLNNAHGDVEALIDLKGEVVNRYQYDAFGNIVESKENVHNRFKYAGEQYDQVTGQYYLRARFYNPVVGRFTQEDTYRGDGLNLYAYVGNNPVNCIDPSGYVCEQKYNLYKQFREQGMTPKQAQEQASLAMDKLKNNAGVGRNRVYDPNKPLSSSNYPNPDPDFSAPPVRYEPKTIDEVIRMRQGKGPTTKATHGDANIEAHHRGQRSMKNGGIMDEIEEYFHRRGGNHTRHQLPSELTPAQRAKEIRDFYKQRGSEYILPGEGI